MDDHDYTLGINTNMQLLENINPSLETGNEFTPLLLNNLSDRHDQQRLEFSFMPLLPDDTDNNPSFNFDGDHQAESFFDPLPHFSTTKEDMVKSLSNFKPRGVTRDNKANKTYSGKKRGKSSAAAKAEKPRGEVVHVRARRGEATDSHSLAERLRREKINRKLRSLQELVPGCYKTMGMSVMLEVTINYIRSLQSQIEFLSMKLTAASMFYDFNSAEMDAFDAMKETNGYEAQVTDTMGTAGEGYNIGNLLHFQSTWPL